MMINLSLNKGILFNWIFKCAMQFDFSYYTVYLAFYILNKIMPHITINTSNAQLLGCVALQMASKFEDESTLRVEDWITACENSFTKEDFLEMEMFVAKEMDWSFVVDTVLTILDRRTSNMSVDKRELCLHYLHLSSCVYFENDIVDLIINAVNNDSILDLSFLCSKDSYYAQNFESLRKVPT